jgi:hypothetical protein
MSEKKENQVKVGPLLLFVRDKTKNKLAGYKEERE